MSAAIDRLLADGPPDRERVERFLADREIPIVENGSVTFVYHGDADDVKLRHWIFGLGTAQSFHRVPDSELWYLTVELPAASRVEYKLERIRGGERELLMDPLNPRVAQDPFGSNSVCYGPGYESPEWAVPDPEARPGSFETVVVRRTAFDGPRPLRVYLPARFRRRRRYPLLIAHDGDDYIRFAELKIVLDNLIHRLEIPPLIVALLGSPDRLREYGADERHARFVATELLPTLEAAFPLIPRPEARGMMGASFGAVAALHAAWTHPGTFGRLLLQSGSFAFSDIGEHGRGPVFDDVARFVNAFRADPGTPVERLFVSCGIYESLIYENRSLVPLLQQSGMTTRYVEARDGHNWDNWRDRLREGLSWLFPGPLWMVYE